MKISRSLVAVGAVAAVLAGCAPSREAYRARPVLAVAQTVPMPGAGDAADDPAIWVHLTDPTRSLIIGTNKQEGLGVYALDGSLVNYYAFGKPNNVDVRYGFPLGGRSVDIAATEDRSNDSIRVFEIDSSARSLAEISAGVLSAGMEVYGSSLYRSARGGGFYFFVGSKIGEVRQFRLTGNAGGKVEAELVRTLKLATQVEGIVADDELGHVYIGEEGRGVWKFDAEPSASAEGTLISPIGGDQPLRRRDVEGLAIHKATTETGYLIASSQGSNEYVVYTREGANDYLGTFRIARGAAIDGAEETDGIDATSGNLGPGFESGAFVAQDGHNAGGNQNFKIVPWSAIAAAFDPPLLQAE